MSTNSSEKLRDLASLRIDREEMEVRRRGGLGMRIVLVLLIISAVAFGSVVAYRKWIEPLAMPEVEVATAVAQAPTQSSALLTASGYVVAQRQASVTSKISGRLAELTVREGSRVKAGQVIGRLESRDLQAQLDESKRALEVARAAHAEALALETEAKQNYERSRNLLGQGVASRSDFDAAEARFKVTAAQAESAAAQIPRAEATVTVAQVALENCLIISPFDGVVTTKNAEIGEIVAPVSVGGPARGNSVVQIADMDSLEAEVDINESHVGRVK